MLTPIYIGNKLEALLGIEQTVRLEDFVTAGNLPIGVTLLDENNEPVLRPRTAIAMPLRSTAIPQSTPTSAMSTIIAI